MFYSEESLAEIKRVYSTIKPESERVGLKYLQLTLKNTLAEEYKSHGFSRRLFTMRRCVENVFLALPIEADVTVVPEREQLQDAVINVQSFVTNAYGCLDNLARVWVSERNLVLPSGKPVKDSFIGLKPQHTFVRSTFSEGFQAYLSGMDAWIAYLEDFRDALAHRIALYIPPFSVTKSNSKRFNELEFQRNEALYIRRNVDEFERLSSEADKLRIFHPVARHSLNSNSSGVAVHPQILADFVTIIEISDKFYEEMVSHM